MNARDAPRLFPQASAIYPDSRDSGRDALRASVAPANTLRRCHLSVLLPCDSRDRRSCFSAQDCAQKSQRVSSSFVVIAVCLHQIAGSWNVGRAVSGALDPPTARPGKHPGTLLRGKDGIGVTDTIFCKQQTGIGHHQRMSSDIAYRLEEISRRRRVGHVGQRSTTPEARRNRRNECADARRNGVGRHGR